ncbi:LysR substrate-binding domain-containing protein [Rathayibacter sp. VKM Ac-2805]|uniref:LysR substrate-binding domain-containing protein n=1 Tax=Rathayibacter sp. VKM Ac-2805 TaxID=2609258 RepID=UPI00131FBC4E|nr:LysR substrate-binding domain-containing protein [Rathayibacter sp. VKM Ac-2805]QHC72574.1 LysR family transcriptional regulator [Rathayibacter sp. VKM Ac-2805]
MATFDLVTLDLLLDVVETSTLTGGAARSRMTTSAASQRIAKLEQLIGQPVLDRLPRGVQLTEAGRVLVERARAVRRELRAAEGELEAIRGLERGTVRLGSFPTVSASLLSDALKDAHAAWPGIEIRVQSALRPQLIDMLSSGEIELALLWSYAWTEETEKNLVLRRLVQDETMLLVAADSPIQDGVPLRSLSREQWITRNGGHPAADVLYRSCARARITPDVVYEAYDYQEVQAMVAAGVGIAMAPRLALATHRDDVRAVSFRQADAVPARTIYLATLARRVETPAIRALSEAVTRAARAFAAAA